VGDALARIGEAGDRPIAPAPGAAGALAPWLIVIGLALVGVSVLVA
jgi:hypothetical protein